MPAIKGKNAMRNILPISVLVAGLALAGVASAGDKAPGQARDPSGPAVTEKAERTGGKFDLEAIFRHLPPHDACFGDRYETDEDLNEGNRITEEEILLIVNPVRS